MNKTELAKFMIGKTIVNGYYEQDGDYHVIEFNDGSETSFRFMSEVMECPFPDSFFENKGIGNNPQDRCDYLKEQLLKFKSLTPPKKLPKHLRNIFMEKVKSKFEETVIYYQKVKSCK